MFEKTIQAFKELKDKSNPQSAIDVRTAIRNRFNLKSTFTLSDYVWYPWYNSAKSDDVYRKLGELNVPKLNIFEFQPATDLAMYINLLSQAIKLAESIGSGAGGVGDILRSISDKLDPMISDLAGIVTASDAGTVRRNFRNGNDYYVGICDGKYVKNFVIPCYNDEIWSAKGGNGWEAMGGIERYLGGMKMASGLISDTLGIDFPAKPKFTASKVPCPIVSSKFYLFNGHISAAIANLDFLYGILPGAHWIQDSFYQRGSNLYTVKFENYYQYQLCTLEATVKMAGKSRRSPAGVISKYSNILMLPDIWEVELTFTSLLPNSLNQFFAPFFADQFDKNLRVGASTTANNPIGNAISSGVNDANSAAQTNAAAGT